MPQTSVFSPQEKAAIVAIASKMGSKQDGPLGEKSDLNTEARVSAFHTAPVRYGMCRQLLRGM